MIKLRQMMVATAVAASALVLPAVPQARTDFTITVGPPPPVIEVVPAPRHGYVWAPGYWSWNGHRHVWSNGHWVRERPGYAWVPDRWNRRGDRWWLERGHWDRSYHSNRGYNQGYYRDRLDLYRGG
jgi:WXXGXW repeat (2 copies)